MGEERTLKEMVFRTFLLHPGFGPREMTDHLQVNYNSVKAIYSKLCDEGLLRREARGTYSPNIPGILLHLMDRIEALEKRLGKAG
ncbi:hypothetical protein CW700_05010 [Candidatus Bathyarchaeota archaeon]|nr:MAG: hypothetical protein CW700_05010 [Candidatus Bathyarchaeota archaeon]